MFRTHVYTRTCREIFIAFSTISYLQQGNIEKICFTTLSVGAGSAHSGPKKAEDNRGVISLKDAQLLIGNIQLIKGCVKL